MPEAHGGMTTPLHVCVLKCTLVFFCTLGFLWVPYALQVKPCLKHMGAWLALILLQVGAEKSSTRKCIGKFRISSCFSRIVFVKSFLSSTIVGLFPAVAMSSAHWAPFASPLFMRSFQGESRWVSRRHIGWWCWIMEKAKPGNGALLNAYEYIQPLLFLPHL